MESHEIAVKYLIAWIRLLFTLQLCVRIRARLFFSFFFFILFQYDSRIGKLETEINMERNQFFGFFFFLFSSKQSNIHTKMFAASKFMRRFSVGSTHYIFIVFHMNFTCVYAIMHIHLFLSSNPIIIIIILYFFFFLSFDLIFDCIDKLIAAFYHFCGFCEEMIWRRVQYIYKINRSISLFSFWKCKWHFAPQCIHCTLLLYNSWNIHNSMLNQHRNVCRIFFFSSNFNTRTFFSFSVRAICSMLFCYFSWQNENRCVHSLVQFGTNYIFFFFTENPSVYAHKIHSRFDIDIDDNQISPLPAFNFSPFSLFFFFVCVHFPLVCCRFFFFFFVYQLSNQLIYMFSCCL